MSVMKIDEYKVEYIIYNNEIMKPKSDIIINLITLRPGMISYHSQMKREKNFHQYYILAINLKNQ